MTNEENDPVVIAPARERLPEIFEALDSLVEATWAAMQKMERAEPGAALVVKHMFDRTFNVLKGAKLLLENDHWELAATHVRLLFEMNLDAEEILSAENPDAAALKYAKFGALEFARYQMANLEYEIASGRDSPETRPRLRALEDGSRQLFSDFLSRKGRWFDSWTGRSIRKRAEDSSHRLKRYQYETVFRFLSAHVHGNPMTVYGPDALLGDDFETRMRSNDRHIVEVTAMLMTWVTELWRTGKDHLPPMTPEVSDALASVVKLMGGPTSPTFDE